MSSSLKSLRPLELPSVSPVIKQYRRATKPPTTVVKWHGRAKMLSDNMAKMLSDNVSNNQWKTQSTA